MQAKPGEVAEAVKYAIDNGYRLFDCAMLYGNEEEIGAAIREKIDDKTVKREDLFIVSKLWNTYHEKENVVPTCKKSLQNFGLEYLDLYLIHWPVAQKLKGELNVSFPFANAEGLDYDYVDTWKGMEECVQLGLAKSIGLSNFNSKQVDRVLEAATVKPVINQVSTYLIDFMITIIVLFDTYTYCSFIFQIELHPNLNQKKLLKFCKDRSIEVMAYSPFGSPTRPWAKPGDPVLSFDDPKLLQIAQKYNKTTAQVILRYIIQLDAIVIPKSTNKQRIVQNADIFDFSLSQQDMDILDTFDCNGRAVAADELKGMPHYPFTGVEF